jgi:hypothetical protein
VVDRVRVTLAFEAAVAIFVVLVPVSAWTVARARVTRFGGDWSSMMMAVCVSKSLVGRVRRAGRCWRRSELDEGCLLLPDARGLAVLLGQREVTWYNPHMAGP